MSGLYKTPDVVASKRRRLEWSRMDQTRVDKRIFESEPGGRKKTGRRGLAWLGNAEKYLRELIVER
jgi:hypothetical protein